jgi:hypothetical protein
MWLPRDAELRRRWPWDDPCAGRYARKAADVAVRVAAAHQTDRVRGFDERPFEVAVDVGAETPVAQLVPARVDAARAPRVAGELLGGGKPGESPISSAITTASVSPTPGTVVSS